MNVNQYVIFYHTMHHPLAPGGSSLFSFAAARDIGATTTSSSGAAYVCSSTLTAVLSLLQTAVSLSHNSVDLSSRASFAPPPPPAHLTPPPPILPVAKGAFPSSRCLSAPGRLRPTQRSKSSPRRESHPHAHPLPSCRSGHLRDHKLCADLQSAGAADQDRGADTQRRPHAHRARRTTTLHHKRQKTALLSLSLDTPQAHRKPQHRSTQ